MTRFKLNFWIFLMCIVTVIIAGAVIYLGLGMMGMIDQEPPGQQITGMILQKETTKDGGTILIVDETNRDSATLIINDRTLFNTLQSFKRYNLTVSNGVVMKAAGPLP